MGGIAQPDVVLEHGGPLSRSETLLRGELAGLLDAIIEVACELSIEEDDRLGGVHAVFRAAKTHYIYTSSPGGISGRNIFALFAQCDHGVGETGTVHVKRERVTFGDFGQRLNLIEGVDGAEFGRLRKGDGAGFRVVNTVSALGGGFDCGRIEFTIFAGERNDFGSAGEKLRSGTFVGIGVGVLVTKNTLMALAG